MIIQQRITEIVTASQGIKGVDLAVKLSAEFMGSSNQCIQQEIELCKQRGDIVEVEYSLPTMKYRVKSFYLPKGTKIIT